MAEIIPYPSTRRWPFILKQAANAAGMQPEAADRYIAHQIQIQRDTMQRKGICGRLIDRELRQLEAAIRRAHFRAPEGRQQQQQPKPSA
jgi:Family of unknown function (DUF6074)